MWRLRSQLCPLHQSENYRIVQFYTCFDNFNNVKFNTSIARIFYNISDVCLIAEKNLAFRYQISIKVFHF